MNHFTLLLLLYNIYTQLSLSFSYKKFKVYVTCHTFVVINPLALSTVSLFHIIFTYMAPQALKTPRSKLLHVPDFTCLLHSLNYQEKNISITIATINFIIIIIIFSSTILTAMAIKLFFPNIQGMG